MLEKDKKCIEFKMRSMMATHKPYQDHSDIEITGIIPDHEIFAANNPFDIPCDVVMVSKSDFERLQTENEQLKKKLHEYDPLPEFHEFLKKVYSTNDIENLEWTLNHVCGGRGSVNGWIAVSLFWKQKYEAISKLVGFVTVEELQDYLTNEANCDTLHEAISKLKDEVKYACNEWYGANSSNNSWKAAAECNSPKELIDKIKGFRDEIGIYSRALKDWKEGTGCPSPSAAKTMIECQTSWHHAYEDAKKKIESLEAALRKSNSTMTKELENNIDEWQKATGRDTPDQAKSRIEGLENAVRLTNRNLIKEIESNIDEWQKATGCSTPEQAKERIKALNERIDESEADYNHLLCTTGFESEGEIEDALDKCDHSTLRKVLVDYEFDYENLLKLTGYKSEHDIRVALNYSEQFVYEDMRELINSLKRKAKFTESGWQVATGRSDPEAAKQYIDRLKGRLNKIHDCAVDW